MDMMNNIPNHNDLAPENNSTTTSVGASLFSSNNIRKRPHSLINNNSILSHQQPSMKPLSASITLPITATAHINHQLGTLCQQQQMHGSVSSISLLEERRDNSINPQDYFSSLLKSRGYPGTTFCSLKCGYHNTPTKLQTVSYGVALTRAIRSSDITTVRSLLAAGLHPNACNQFGESIVHAACRRDDFAMLNALIIESRSSVQVTDDFGRTPLHDACWTSSPNFDSIRLLLDQDPWLLCVKDCRGSTPLGYVRKAHWDLWISFLGAVADRYWPTLTGQQEDQVRVDKVPPLATLEPNSNLLPDPKPRENQLNLDVIELLANGDITPQEIESNGSKTIEEIKTSSLAAEKEARVARITFDPMRQIGSNATTMLEISQDQDGYARIVG